VHAQGGHERRSLNWPQTCIYGINLINICMKTFVALCFVALSFSACTIENVEPRFDPRDRIVGHYEVEEYSETYRDFTYYSLHISKSGYSNEIWLDNFYAADISVYAVLNHDRITIPYQVKDGYEIEGVGTIYGNEIDLNYSVRDRYNNSRTDFCETKAWLEY
jgi:hypothetical protein